MKPAPADGGELHNNGVLSGKKLAIRKTGTSIPYPLPYHCRIEERMSNLKIRNNASPSTQTPSFFDREASQLEFNRRVLAQAENPALPLLERLRYLCILSNNLDEFFEVRVASLLAVAKLGSAPGAALQFALERIDTVCHALIAQQYAILNETVLPGLAQTGIRLLRHADRNTLQRAWVHDYFIQQVRPLLPPVGLDPAHPFPQIVNKSLNFIVALSGNDSFGRGSAIAILKAPRALPRVIELPAHLSKDGSAFCLLSSVIHTHMAELFHGREVVGYSQFRVTRDSDLWVDEEELTDLRLALRSELAGRHYGTAVRLEVALNCPDELSGFLLNQFGLDRSRLYAVDGPVNLVRLTELIAKVTQPALSFPAFIPGTSTKLDRTDVFALLKQDMLLHHPFESFQPVLDFIRAAALDPAVVAIRQTIYRTGMNSSLMESLIIAARAGKEVTVILELMARFDEEANMNWADQLEQAGAQVVYGVVGLKTHAKMALVIRREAAGLRLYAHLGTGNYHPTTTKLYTDFGLLTSNQALASEVNEVFMHLTSLTRPQTLKHLWLAPFFLQANIIKAIGNEASISRAGGRGRVIVKVNALIDEDVIRALYDASAAGVKIDLIVRGACTLRPGVAGLSENIRVHSIIGRFLEHSRIYYFRNRRAHDVYLSSADWMSRNLLRRIEVAFPVLDEALKRRVIWEGLLVYLRDRTDAWQLDSNGQYCRRHAFNKRPAMGAQARLMKNLGVSSR